VSLALLYGSVAKGTDTARSDIDILIVAHGITLEDVYSALDPVEKELDHKISPTLYTPDEFARRKASNNPFLTRVLAGEHLVLIDKENEPSTSLINPHISPGAPSNRVNVYMNNSFTYQTACCINCTLAYPVFGNI
jgi:hypothetical protein